jgi:hypothetical protein
MKVAEVKEIAARKGIKAGKMTKTELIRAVQTAEGNPTCFGSGRAATCGEADCLWREDCE